jgi:hypothetical protein
MNTNPRIKYGNVELDDVSIFLAAFLSWARRYRAFGTRLPMVSYRGHSCDAWKLLPSLCRAYPTNARHLAQIEEEVVSEFRGQFNLTDYSDLEVLAYARHHGAPTRLLDWSRNPFVGLWFSVSDKSFDAIPGTIFQLVLLGDSDLIGTHLGDITLEHIENCDTSPCGVFVIPSPPKIERTHRQQSNFTIARFKNDYAIKPLDEICSPNQKMPIRKFTVPAALKPELRRTLAELGLDAYGIYGGADAFGKTLSALFDISDLKTPKVTNSTLESQSPIE